MTTKSQIHQHPLSRPILWRSRNLSRRSLWRRRITYTSAQKKSILQNKPNYCRFWAKNSYLEEKQTQFKPNQTQFFALFLLPILPDWQIKINKNNVLNRQKLNIMPYSYTQQAQNIGKIQFSTFILLAFVYNYQQS